MLRRDIDDRNSERFTDAELNASLNEAQRAVQLIINSADEAFFSACQSYSVVASDDSYEFSLPSTIMKIILAERLVTAGRPIPADWIDFRRRHLEDTVEEVFQLDASERPRCYLRGAKLGVIAPRSSYTLRLWYTYAIPDLAGDSDESEIPAEHRRLLCLHAAKEILGGADDGGDTPGWLKEEYEAATDRLRLYIETRARQKAREVVYDPDC
jgi:hypothetical protein